jgi:hypothetical protein
MRPADLLLANLETRGVVGRRQRDALRRRPCFFSISGTSASKTATFELPVAATGHSERRRRDRWNGAQTSTLHW